MQADADHAYWLARVRNTNRSALLPASTVVSAATAPPAVVQIADAAPSRPESPKAHLAKVKMSVSTAETASPKTAKVVKAVKPSPTTTRPTDVPTFPAPTASWPARQRQPAISARPASALTPRQWAEISRINTRVNGAMAMRPDVVAFGVDDLWQAPGQTAARYGDCEDYVLQKRHDLIAAGFSTADLSIAIVSTPWGQAHAVLLLADADGEYVLDNLSTWVLPWSATRYRWVERQAPGRPLDWVTVG